MSAKIGMCGLALVAVAGVVAAADWPQWRGPERDGFCLEKGLRTDWTQPPKKLWQVATPGEG
jgi:hypothetical protein